MNYHTRVVLNSKVIQTIHTTTGLNKLVYVHYFQFSLHCHVIIQTMKPIIGTATLVLYCKIIRTWLSDGPPPIQTYQKWITTNSQALIWKMASFDNISNTTLMQVIGVVILDFHFYTFKKSYFKVSLQLGSVLKRQEFIFVVIWNKGLKTKFNLKWNWLIIQTLKPIN